MRVLRAEGSWCRLAELRESNVLMSQQLEGPESPKGTPVGKSDGTELVQLVEAFAAAVSEHNAHHSRLMMIISEEEDDDDDGAVQVLRGIVMGSGRATGANG